MRVIGARIMTLAALIALANASPAASQPKTATPKLSAAQRQLVWDNIWHGQTGGIPIGFEASIGTTVPPAIKLQSMPRPVADQIPDLKSLDYVRSRNQILLVDPTNRKVVAMLNR